MQSSGRNTAPPWSPAWWVFFMVERVIMKRLHGNHAEFFVKCKNYSRLENTWEPSEHLLGDLIPDFESMSVDGHGTSVRGGIETPLRVLSEAHNEPRCYPVPVSEDTVRSLWQSVPGVGEEELAEAALASSLKKCLTVTGAGRVKLFIGRSLQFLDEHGHKSARHPGEKVQVMFTKSCFTGTEDWNPRSTKRLL